jgi:hypothetical protein
MKIHSILILLCISTTSLAQYVEPDNSKSDIQTHKNSIGIGLNPMMAVAIGADASHVHYGLQYKRSLSENKMLRITGFIQGEKNGPELGEPIGLTDSSLFVNSSYDQYSVIELRAGLEWSNYKERFDGFYGFDTGIDRQTTLESVHQYKIDTEEGPDLYGQLLGKDTLTYFTDDYLMIGLAPFFGYRVGIGKRFDLTAWMSPEFVYMAPLRSDTHGVQQIHRQNAYIDFRLRLLDVMLSYRF